MDSSFIIFVGIGTWLGAAMAVRSKKTITEAKASSKWPSTQGHITQSTVTFGPGGVHGTRLYRPEIEYEYEVSGVKQRANAVSFGPLTALSDPQFANDRVAKFPVGKAVAVFYNPENPEEAILEPGTNAGAYIMFGIGLGVFIGGAIFIIKWFMRGST